MAKFVSFALTMLLLAGCGGGGGFASNPMDNPSDGTRDMSGSWLVTFDGYSIPGIAIPYYATLTEHHRSGDGPNDSTYYESTNSGPETGRLYLNSISNFVWYTGDYDPINPLGPRDNVVIIHGTLTSDGNSFSGTGVVSGNNNLDVIIIVSATKL